MVNRYKGSRSVAASDGVSASSKDSDQVYCVLLHVVEGELKKLVYHYFL